MWRWVRVYYVCWCVSVRSFRAHFFSVLLVHPCHPLSLCWGGGGREVTIATMPGQINIKRLQKCAYMYEGARICGKEVSIALDTRRVTPKTGGGIDVNASITNNSLGAQSLHHSVSFVWFPSTCLLPYFVVSALPFPFPSLSLSVSLCVVVCPQATECHVLPLPSSLSGPVTFNCSMVLDTQPQAKREKRGDTHIHAEREKKGWGPRDEALCMSGERQRGKERGQVWKVVRKDVRMRDGEAVE